MYKNYIFDLYGTLIDVVTDEEDYVLWNKLAELYSVYGADYTSIELKKTYKQFVLEEEKKLGGTYPEIKLEKVFARLMKESNRKHETALDLQSLSIDELAQLVYVNVIANTFRVLSRKKCHLYKNTIKVLKELKNQGAHIYLLSNAQRVFTYPEIEKCGLIPYFDDIFISSDEGIKKPDDEFMKRLIKKHKLNIKKSVMVGNDFRSDIEIAKKVGMDSIFLNTFKYQNDKLRYELNRLEGYKPLIVKDGDIDHILNH